MPSRAPDKVAPRSAKPKPMVVDGPRPLVSWLDELPAAWLAEDIDWMVLLVLALDIYGGNDRRAMSKWYLARRCNHSTENRITRAIVRLASATPVRPPLLERYSAESGRLLAPGEDDAEARKGKPTVYRVLGHIDPTSWPQGFPSTVAGNPAQVPPGEPLHGGGEREGMGYGFPPDSPRIPLHGAHVNHSYTNTPMASSYVTHDRARPGLNADADVVEMNPQEALAQVAGQVGPHEPKPARTQSEVVAELELRIAAERAAK